MKGFYKELLIASAILIATLIVVLYFVPNPIGYELADNVVSVIVFFYLIAIIQSYKKHKKIIKEKEQKE